MRSDRLPYGSIITNFNQQVSKEHGIDTSIDIFEHSFLSFLGCEFFPEKCSIYPNQNDVNTFYMDITLPSNIDIENAHIFKAYLEDILQQKGYKEVVQFTDARNTTAPLQLKINALFVKNKLEQIIEKTNLLLENDKRKEFYKYWMGKQQKSHETITLNMEYIEGHLVATMNKGFPPLSKVETWSALLKKLNNLPKTAKLDLNIDAVFPINNDSSEPLKSWPAIKFTCKLDDSEKTYTHYRHEIVECLNSPEFIDYLPFEKYELLCPTDHKQFLDSKLHRKAKFTKDRVVIELGYYEKMHQLIKLYKIKYKIQKRTGVLPERACYYEFDYENYIKTIIGMKELGGQLCKIERWDQIKYHISHKEFKKLNELLLFLLDVNCNYADLIFDLYVSNKIIRSDEIYDILENKFNLLIESKNIYGEDNSKKAADILDEICITKLQNLNQLQLSEDQKYSIKDELKKKQFSLSLIKKDDTRTVRLFEELAGLNMQEIKNQGICTGSSEFFIELAAIIKNLNEENTTLNEENTTLKDKLTSYQKAGADHAIAHRPPTASNLTLFTGNKHPTEDVSQKEQYKQHSMKH